MNLKDAVSALLAPAALVLATLALLGAMGAVWTSADVANQLAPIWLLASAIGLALTPLLSRGPRRAILFGAFALAAGVETALIAPEFLSARAFFAPRPAPDAAELKLVALNVWGDEPNTQATLNYLAGSEADILILSGVNTQFEMALEALRTDYPHWIRCTARPFCQVLILSKLAPEREAARLPPPIDWRTVPMQDFLPVADARFRLRAAPGAPSFRVIGVHMGFPRPAYVQTRHYRSLLGELARAERESAILAGDFNTAPWSFRLRRFDAESGLERYTRALPTWPAHTFSQMRLAAPIPFAPFDHVYAGSAWRLARLRRGPRSGADHYPIEAVFAWHGVEADQSSGSAGPPPNAR